MRNGDVSKRVKAVKEITSLFRLERFVYLSIIVVCLLILLISVSVALIKGTIDPVGISTIFGSGGAVTVMTGRLLHMWNRAMKLLNESND